MVTPSKTPGRGLDPASIETARWGRERFAVPSRSLARALLGRWLVRRLDSGTLLIGRIVETEAYLGVRDAASHAYRGRRTPRNEAMYAQAGTAYVYFTYGMHYCMNVVCAREGVPEAVLLRALEPVAGIPTMRQLRARPGIADREIASGPARLCQAMAIDKALNGEDLARSRTLWIAEPRPDIAENPLNPKGLRPRVVRAPRIGVDYAGDWAHKPLRYLYHAHPHVSVAVPKRRKPK